MRLLQPLDAEGAMQATAQREHQSGKRRQIELALEQARYKETRARRQYDTIDPENCLVAHELDRRVERRPRDRTRTRGRTGDSGPTAVGRFERRGAPGPIANGGRPGSRVASSGDYCRYDGSCCARSWHTSRVTRFICCCIGRAAIIRACGEKTADSDVKPPMAH